MNPVQRVTLAKEIADLRAKLDIAVKGLEWYTSTINIPEFQQRMARQALAQIQVGSPQEDDK